MTITCPSCKTEFVTPTGLIERRKAERGIIYCPVCTWQVMDFRKGPTVVVTQKRG